jgi:ABC-type multidrug transport system permease subunit
MAVLYSAFVSFLCYHDPQCDCSFVIALIAILPSMLLGQILISRDDCEPHFRLLSEELE